MQTQWKQTNGSRRLVAIRPDAAASDLRNNMKRKKDYQKECTVVEHSVDGILRMIRPKPSHTRTHKTNSTLHLFTNNQDSPC